MNGSPSRHNPLRRPPWHPHWRNTPGAVDPQLLERARNERWFNAGITAEAFRVYNVAVVRYRVGNAPYDYLEAGNFPQRYGGLMHSEEYLLWQAQQIARRGQPLIIDQLYSERIPCRAQCMPKIEQEWPGINIFYTVATHDYHLGLTRARQLAAGYGWAL